MYAVIETGGKQYRVEVGTELEVELLDVEPGDAVTLDRVLLVADGDEAAVGRPVVTDAAVQAEVLRRDRGEKVIAFKYRPKARRRVKKGHRQELTVLRIADITFNGRSAAETTRRAEEARRTERERLEEAAAKQAAEDAALAERLAARKPAETTGKPGRRRGASAATPEAAATPETAATPEEAGQPEGLAEPIAPVAETPKRTRARAHPTATPVEADTSADATGPADAAEPESAVAPVTTDAAGAPGTRFPPVDTVTTDSDDTTATTVPEAQAPTSGDDTPEPGVPPAADEKDE